MWKSSVQFKLSNTKASLWLSKSLSSLLLGNTEGYLDTKGGCPTLFLHSSPDI